MPKIKELLHTAKQELEAIGIATAQLDAEILLAHALGVERDALFMRYEEDVPAAVFKALLARRVAFEPVAYILGHKEFWGLDFRVTKDTLIPRPDSETLIEFVLSTYPNRDAPYKILDLGTGTGCLGLSLLSERYNAQATLVDLCPRALEVVRYNGQNLNLAHRTTIVQSSWFNSLALQEFDIIICNPPYIAKSDPVPPDVALYEPHSALFAEEQGLAEYKEIAGDLHKYMGPTSTAFFEFGQGQENVIHEIFSTAGYTVIGIKKDLAGISRVMGVRK